MEQAVTEASQTSSGGSGGSSAGGGSRPSAGGWTGGSGITVDQETLQNIYDEKEHNSTAFLDIEQVPWAKEAIEALAAAGVVSGRENGIFAPEEMVTREEFVKMLLLGLSFDIEQTSTDFSDVEAGAWYEPYIGTAAALNITVGSGDGSFGVGVPITRQDAAVMIVRAVTLKEIDFSENEKEIFADDEQIANYAKESVYLLAQGGVIQGVGENQFAPLQEITRAETAKMIYGVRGQMK